MNRVVWNPNAVKALLKNKQVTERLEQLGDMVAERARQRVPVDTGELRNSIDTETVTGKGGAPEVRVVASAPHAMYVELGTERSRPRPFLRPALAFIRRGSGGSDAGLSRVKASKSARKRSARNRALARDRRQS